MGIGLKNFAITDADPDGSKVGVRANRLDPPRGTNQTEWQITHVERARISNDSVTFEASIRRAESVGAGNGAGRVSIQAPWTAVLSAGWTFTENLGEYSELVLRVSVEGADEIVTASYDLSQLDESFTTPQSEQPPQPLAGVEEDASQSIGSDTSGGSRIPEATFAGSEGLVPFLKQYRRNEDDELVLVREMEPLVVTRLGGTLPFETASTQLQCGETITEANGDMNIRLVYHATCTLNQLDTLRRMRSNPGKIKLISHFYSGWADFDEMRVDRITDANGVVTATGNVDQPIYKVQLQSKESEEPSGGNI